MKRFLLSIVLVLSMVTLSTQTAKVVIEKDDFTGKLKSVQAKAESSQLDVNVFWGDTYYGQYYLAQILVPLSTLKGTDIEEKINGKIDVQSDHSNPIFHETVAADVLEGQLMVIVIIIPDANLSEINAIRIPYFSKVGGQWVNQNIIIQSSELFDDLNVAFKELHTVMVEQVWQ